MPTFPRKPFQGVSKSMRGNLNLPHKLLQDALIRMYDKCGSLVDARRVFDQMTERDVFSWNVIIAAYRRHGYANATLSLFQQMQVTSVQPDQFTFASILPACAKIRALEQGMDIHQSIIDKGFLSDVVVASALVDLYAKCGSIHKACQLFEKMPQRDVVSWNSMIAGYAQNGDFDKALRLLEEMPQTNVVSWNAIIAGYARNGFVEKALKTFKQMQLAGVKPDSSTFASILPACAKMGDLEHGMDINQSIIENGFLTDVVVASALLDMYAKCGSIHKASEVFDKMPQRDVVSWNAMIAGYAQNGFVEKALETLKQMQLAGVKPNSRTFATILPTCGKMGALELSLNIHQSIIESGLFLDVVVASALVDMYAKHGRVHKARELFEKMPKRDVVSWTAMIAGYAQNGFVEKALETFKQMQLAGVNPDSTTFVSILPACAKMGDFEQGTNIHQSIIESGFLSDVVVASALLDMYAKCGSMHMAQKLFNKMPRRDVVSWNAMIAGYAQNGFVEKALENFKQMQLADVKPDSTTFASTLPACTKMGALEHGIDIHQSIIESGLLSDVVVTSALVDMYAKCENIHKAHELFDKMTQRDVVSWNTMIAGYAQNGFVEKALETFKQMQLTGVKPDPTTFSSILPACAKMGALEQGMDIHQSVIESGSLSDVLVASALVDMYAKCGSIHKARHLFDKMPQKNVISCNAMISGYAQNGFVEKALETFEQMQLAGVNADSTTVASILPACAKMGALEQGMDIHKDIIETGFLSDVVVTSALVDMYAKCGNIHKACKLFEKMPQKNVVSWTAMIAGYAQNGFCKDSLKLFELMKHSGTHPNHVSFACVLLACSHAGLVDEGCKYFNGMSDSYCFKPTIDQYVCMVDLLGRAGYLEETLNFIIKMPIKPVMVVWTCLLGACRTHKNIGLGVFIATFPFELDPNNAVTYVLLSNIYAEVGRWGEVQMLRRLMKDRGIKKIPGCSWIESRKMVHVFCVGDRSHPQTQDIYAILEKLSWEMKAAGYFADSRHALNDVEEEEKELFLCHHSEKLAIAFGLLNTPIGTTIRVVKNLRVCVDCHTSTKFISKIVARQIVVRDANRFHHFKQGQCSCGDYW